MVQGRPPLRILDVGCGPGWLAKALTDAGHTVVGVDIAEADGVHERMSSFVQRRPQRGHPRGGRRRLRPRARGRHHRAPAGPGAPARATWPPACGRRAPSSPACPTSATGTRASASPPAASTTTSAACSTPPTCASSPAAGSCASRRNPGWNRSRSATPACRSTRSGLSESQGRHGHHRPRRPVAGQRVADHVRVPVRLRVHPWRGGALRNDLPR